MFLFKDLKVIVCSFLPTFFKELKQRIFTEAQGISDISSLKVVYGEMPPPSPMFPGLGAFHFTQQRLHSLIYRDEEMI